MDTRKTILYIHGMGGGGDSRIPGIMRDALRTYDSVRLIIRTYDFNPDIASGQIASWVKEVSPDLVIGESMGAIHALAIGGVPHLLVSPSLNAPVFFGLMGYLVLQMVLQYMRDGTTQSTSSTPAWILPFGCLIGMVIIAVASVVKLIRSAAAKRQST